jgi:hypothetical protein
LAQTVAGRPESIHDQDQRVKLAHMIDDMDRETGLNRFVEDLEKPEDVFFAITEKAASQLRRDHVATITGNMYKRSDFDRLKLSEVKDLMGSDFADAVTTGGLLLCPEKLAELVPTLPRADADLFDRLMLDAGINPMAKEAAHVKDGFDEDELAALASLHRR